MKVLCRAVAVTFTTGVLALTAAGTPVRAGSGTGLLVGRTLITFGCPGPVRVGIACPRWHPFSHARFTIRQVGPSGQPLPLVSRLVASDSNARFTLRLSGGDYLLTSLPQQHTRGSKSITIHIQAGHTTQVTLRYIGYPQML